MTCINPGNDGSCGGCGKWWVDVSYLWDDVDCPECLKLRPTKRAPDAGESARFTIIFLASGLSCSQAVTQPAHKPVTQTVRCFVPRSKLFENWCPNP